MVQSVHFERAATLYHDGDPSPFVDGVLPDGWHDITQLSAMSLGGLEKWCGMHDKAVHEVSIQPPFLVSCIDHKGNIRVFINRVYPPIMRHSGCYIVSSLETDDDIEVFLEYMGKQYG
jgi:hypothetical protein